MYYIKITILLLIESYIIHVFLRRNFTFTHLSYIGHLQPISSEDTKKPSNYKIRASQSETSLVIATLSEHKLLLLILRLQSNIDTYHPRWSSLKTFNAPTSSYLSRPASSSRSKASTSRWCVYLVTTSTPTPTTLA